MSEIHFRLFLPRHFFTNCQRAQNKWGWANNHDFLVRLLDPSWIPKGPIESSQHLPFQSSICPSTQNSETTSTPPHPSSKLITFKSLLLAFECLVVFTGLSFLGSWAPWVCPIMTFYSVSFLILARFVCGRDSTVRDPDQPSRLCKWGNGDPDRLELPNGGSAVYGSKVDFYCRRTYLRIYSQKYESQAAFILALSKDRNVTKSFTKDTNDLIEVLKSGKSSHALIEERKKILKTTHDSTHQVTKPKSQFFPLKPA